MTFDRQGLEIGPFDLLGLTINPTFHWYGLIIVTGIIAAAMLVMWMAKRDERDPDHVSNALIWIVILAVIGARVWHVLFPSVSSVEAGRTTSWYLSHPFDLHEGPFILWSGGLSIFGAVLGGALGVFLYTRKNRLEALPWMDMAVIGVTLGQAIGRWGNFVNEELYGKPTDLPWGLRIEHPPVEYAGSTHFHPLFLYESLWSLFTCAVLLVLWLKFRQRLKRGDFLLLYMVFYGVARFALEFLRIEIAEAGGVNVSQAFSLAAAVLGALLLLWRHRKSIRPGPDASTSRRARST